MVMVQSVTAKINDDEAALYDRQIRLWGLDAQNRLRNSSVLLIGLNGLGAEIAKNLMLAGLKSLTLMDDAKISEQDLKSQFLARNLGENRAEASLNKCQQLNPLVKVVVETANFLTKNDEFYKQFDLVCFIMDGFDENALKINEICRRTGIKFACGACFGWFGYCFSDFLDHEFVEEIKVTEAENEEAGSGEPAAKKLKTVNTDDKEIVKTTEQFVSLSDALKIDVTAESRKKWKRVPSGFLILQILIKFSNKFHRRPMKATYTEDVKELEIMKNHLIEELSTATGEKIDIPNFDANLLFHELSPVSAIIGGVLAQELIKALSKKDRPLNNLFFYNCFDFTGTVGKFPLC